MIKLKRVSYHVGPGEGGDNYDDKVGGGYSDIYLILEGDCIASYSFPAMLTGERVQGKEFDTQTLCCTGTLGLVHAMKLKRECLKLLILT